MRTVLTVSLAAALVVLSACGRERPGGKTLNEIATIYRDGNPKVASFELRKFVEKHPNHDLAWTILGHTYEDQDLDRDAADCYRRALSLNPKRVEAITGMGILARKRGDDEEALRQYRLALEADPKYAQAWSSMTVIALANSRDAEGLRYAEKAWELDPEDATIAANLAAAYHYNGMNAKRDEMTVKAEKMGYRKIETLRKIYSGEMTLRK